MPKQETYMHSYWIKEAREKDSMDHLTIHRINIDYHSKDKRGGWYRQVGSMEGFHGRITKRFSKHWYTKKNYHLGPQVKFGRADFMDVESLKIFCENINKYGKAKKREYYPTIKWVNWGSIWDFFDHIGYDHKDKSVKQIDKFIILNKK